MASLLLSVSIAHPVFANGPMCSRVFDRDEYEWLERDSIEKNDWVQRQTGLVNAFVKNSPNRAPIEKFLTDYFSIPNAMDAAAGKGPDGKPFVVQIVDRGLGRDKPVDVEITRDGVKKTLLSSYDFKRNNSVIPVGISISPDGSFLLVKTALHGSLDSFTGTVIDLATGKRLRTIPKMDAGEPVWISKNELHYDEYGLDGLEKKVKIENGTAAIFDRGDSLRYQASDDHQWTYAGARFGDGTIGIVVTSMETGKQFALPAMRVKNIFQTSKDELWVLTAGKKQFGEIVRVRLTDGKAAVQVVVPESNLVRSAAAILKDHLVVNEFLGGDRWIDIIDPKAQSSTRIKAPDCCQMMLADFDPQSKVATVVMNSPARRKVKWFFDAKTEKWSVDDDGKPRPADVATEMMSDGGVEFVTTYHEYKSKDGTVIPVRITHRKDAVFDGNAPTLLEGYGGFASNNYFHPEYNPVRLEFLRAGGVQIAPALRGSAFFGEPWHDAGRALNKQNVMDDFIGAAEWAIARKITQPKKIAISGASHGGLLVGAVLVQRPELFGLALPQFGPHDFANKPFLDPVTTPSQKGEYGDLFDDPAAIANAKRISPFLNAIPREYPMTVVITGQKDSRVNPDHSFRFAAHLQDSQRGKAPILMYALKNSGHWMMSEDRQDVIGWRSNVTYWSIVFDYFGLKMRQ